MSTAERRGIAWVVPPDPNYPDSDGEPIAENTTQYEWIVTIVGGLRARFRRDPNVFVAGDLFWYPVEGHPEIRTAPDALVVIGRPRGERGSYMQWKEDGLAPQVVFEVLSPGNRAGAMNRKRRFYEQYGVDEYYIYDPDEPVELLGYLRDGEILQPIPDLNGWISPRLEIRFDTSGKELRIFHPDGEPFKTFMETIEDSEERGRRAEVQRKKVRREQRRVRKERLKAEEERLKAEEERLKAEEERLKAEEERLKAEEQRLRADRLAAQLRALGIEPEV